MPKPKKLTRTARLANKDLIHPPPWLPDNIMLEGLTGSFAYGCEDPKKADRDIVGIVIPPKTVIFPHLAGYIQGFGTQPPKFDQFQAHGIEAKDERKTYDITIYNIVKFFQLAAELDKLYDDKESPIPHKPDEDKIKALLLECLEIHYGSLNTTIAKDVSVEALLDEIELVTSKYRKQTEGKK